MAAEKDEAKGVPARRDEVRPDKPTSPEEAEFQGLIEKYRSQAEKYNVLVPQEVGPVAPWHRPSVAVIQADTRIDDKGRPTGGDIYPLPGGQKFGLSKVFLDRVSAAGGIKWSWPNSGRIDKGDDPRRVAYRAAGTVKGLDGEWRPIMGDKEISMDVIEEELRDNAKRNLGYEKNQPRDPEAWIAEKVRKEAIQIQKHIYARAQSGAMNRAIRMAYGIRSGYSLEELKRPFVIPKVVFSPDLHDPQVKAHMLAKWGGEADAMYPQRPLGAGSPAPALPAGDVDIIQDPDTGDLVNRRTGEVIRDAQPPDEDTQSAPSQPEPDALEVAWTEAIEANDAKRQIECLQKLMKRKGYHEKGRQLREPLDKFTAQARKQFWEHLWALEDLKAQEQPKLPWE